MDKIQNSGIDELSDPSMEQKFKKPLKKKVMFSKQTKEDQKPPPNYEEKINKYSREANEGTNSRHRRAARRDEIKNTCSLFIQTDPLIWRHIKESFPEVSRFFHSLWKMLRCITQL